MTFYAVCRTVAPGASCSYPRGEQTVVCGLTEQQAYDKAACYNLHCLIQGVQYDARPYDDAHDAVAAGELPPLAWR